MQNSRVTETIAGLITLGAVAVIFSTRGWPPSVNHTIHEAIGRALAREAVGLLSDGGQITVITRDTATFKQPAAEILMEGFKREVRRERAATVKTFELQVDPLK